MTTLVAEIEIKNRMGLHARPAAMLVQATNKFESDVLIKKNDMEVNAKSILGVMMLAAECGSRLTVTVSGEDAAEALETVKSLFENKFDEEEGE